MGTSDIFHKGPFEGVHIGHSRLLDSCQGQTYHFSLEGTVSYKTPIIISSFQFNQIFVLLNLILP